MTKAGVVMHDRSTTRQITRAAIAEPPACRSDVEVLGDTELPGAVLNVRPKRRGRRRALTRADEPVAGAQQGFAVRGVGWVDVERELDRASDVGRHVEV